MHFMITFNHIDGVWDDLSEEARAAHGDWLAKFVAELKAEKNAQLVFMSPADQRKTVRKHPDGAIQIEDGPFAPGPEQIGGYYIIEADSWEEAVEWGRRGRWLTGSNEVRQIFGDGV
jgi:hypothetical protein